MFISSTHRPGSSTTWLESDRTVSPPAHAASRGPDARSPATVQRLVRNAFEQVLRRPGSHLALQLRREMRREDRAVHDVTYDDNSEQREQRRLHAALRPRIGP